MAGIRRTLVIMAFIAEASDFIELRKRDRKTAVWL